MTHARLVAGPRELLDFQHRGKVNQGPRDRGDRDPAPGHRVARIDATRSPRNHAVDPPLGRRNHFRRRRPAFEQMKEMTRSPPAEEAPIAARANRRQVARFEAGRAMTDAVDTAVLAEQGAGAQPVLDLLARNT
jgi:hypothetical protein